MTEIKRFFERYDSTGNELSYNEPRITGDDSLSLFHPRDKGLKIVIINPPIREWSYPNIMPLGQGYVASVAMMDGHKVYVLDLNALRQKPIESSPIKFSKWVSGEIIKCLENHVPDVICIGGIITQYKRIKEITTLCKKSLPNVPIILGGGIASCMPEFMVQRLPIDVAVQKEGEITFSEVLTRIEKDLSLEGCKGIVYRYNNGKTDWEVKNNGLRGSVAAGWKKGLSKNGDGLNSFPWPLRSKWPIDEVYKNNPVGHLNWASKWNQGAPGEGTPYSISMLASRGCPYAVSSCDYCYASYLGVAYRLRSPKEVVDEMAYLKRRYDLKYVHFLDDLMMTDYRWALEFFDEIKKRNKRDGFEIEFGCTSRTNIIADDIKRAKNEGRQNILEAGYEVGWRQVGYGVESASPTILKLIDKSGQTVEKMETAILETQRVMGYADCSFMIASPGESEKTVKETVDFCKKVGLAPEVFFFTTAYPATPFWDLALEKGLIGKAVTGKNCEADDDIIEQFFIKLGEQGDEVRTNFSDLSDEKIIDLSWWAVQELGAQNTLRHPHTGDIQNVQKSKARGATVTDL